MEPTEEKKDHKALLVILFFLMLSIFLGSSIMIVSPAMKDSPTHPPDTNVRSDNSHEYISDTHQVTQNSSGFLSNILGWFSKNDTVEPGAEKGSTIAGINLGAPEESSNPHSEDSEDSGDAGAGNGSTETDNGNGTDNGGGPSDDVTDNDDADAGDDDDNGGGDGGGGSVDDDTNTGDDNGSGGGGDSSDGVTDNDDTNNGDDDDNGSGGDNGNGGGSAGGGSTDDDDTNTGDDDDEGSGGDTDDTNEIINDDNSGNDDAPIGDNPDAGTDDEFETTPDEEEEDEGGFFSGIVDWITGGGDGPIADIIDWIVGGGDDVVVPDVGGGVPETGGGETGEFPNWNDCNDWDDCSDDWDDNPNCDGWWDGTNCIDETSGDDGMSETGQNTIGGLSCRFDGAQHTKEYGRVLVDGKSAIAERFTFIVDGRVATERIEYIFDSSYREEDLYYQWEPGGMASYIEYDEPPYASVGVGFMGMASDGYDSQNSDEWFEDIIKREAADIPYAVNCTKRSSVNSGRFQPPTPGSVDRILPNGIPLLYKYESDRSGYGSPSVRPDNPTGSASVDTSTFEPGSDEAQSVDAGAPEPEFVPTWDAFGDEVPIW